MARAQYKPLLWFSFNDHMQEPWCAYLTSPDLTPELICRNRKEAARGLCYNRTRRIYINAAYDEPTQVDTVVHEMMHASYRGRKHVGEVEEEMVTAMEPGMSTIVQQFRFRLPARPRGYEALSRHATAITRLLASGKARCCDPQWRGSQ